MKKRLLALAFAAFAAIGLSACGPEEGHTPGTDPSQEGFIKDPTTIYLWTTSGDSGQTLLNRWVEEFKEIEPNVTVVNVKQSGSYNDLENMVITGFTANNYPDLVAAYPDHVADYIDYGKAVQLDDYIDNAEYGWTAEEKADFVPAYLKEGQEYTVPGTWSLPFSKSTEAMFYNEDVLIGLDLSSVDSTINNGNPINAPYLSSLTWEELFNKLCPALLKYDAEVKDIIQPCDDGVTRVFGYDSDDNLFITLAKQYNLPYTSVNNGKGSVDFNTPEMKELLTKFHDAYENGYFTTKGANEGNYVNELFTANQLLFSVGSTGGTTYQFNSNNPMNVGVAMIPQAENGTTSTIMQGPSMAILDHSDENRRLASWLFYKYITNEDNALSWGLDSTGYFPIRLSALENPVYLAACDETAAQDKSLEKLLARVNNYFNDVNPYLFVSPAFKGSSTIRTQVGGLFTQALLQDPSNLDKLFADAESASNLAL